MLFYKYQSVSPLSLAMLRHGEVFFASPQELNDTHEAKPRYIFRGDDDIWGRFMYLVLVEICVIIGVEPKSELSKKILSLSDGVISQIKSARKTSFEYQELINFLSLGIQQAMPTDWNDRDKKIIYDSYSYYINNIFEGHLEELIYITSFSLSATSLTMWGHYGDAEKGFCLVYESSDGSVEIENDCELFWGSLGEQGSFRTIGQVKKTSVSLKKVKYAKNPVRINGFGRLSKRFFYSEYESHYDYREEVYSKTTDMHEESIGLVKFTDWKYEKEIRLHLPVYGEIPSSLRSVRINVNHIKGIIFGPKISRANKNNLLAALAYLKKSYMKKGEIFIFDANVITNKYKIQVMPLGTLRDFYSPEIPMIISLSETSQKNREEAEMISEIINQS
jgi:hypothetical protein